MYFSFEYMVGFLEKSLRNYSIDPILSASFYGELFALTLLFNSVKVINNAYHSEEKFVSF